MEVALVRAFVQKDIHKVEQGGIVLGHVGVPTFAVGPADVVVVVICK